MEEAFANVQPDERRRRGILSALERYYRALGLARWARRAGDEPSDQVDPVEAIRPPD